MSEHAGDDVPAPGSDGTTTSGPRWRLVAAVAAVVALVTLLTLVVVNRDGDGEHDVTSGAPATTQETTTTTSRPASTTTGAPSTIQASEPTAADTLEPFLSAATTMDQQLEDAATAINGSGPPWTSVSDDVANVVATADLQPVIETIPAGLPDDLLQPVMLVLSDLWSRRAAMETFASPRVPLELRGRDLLDELRNGHAAAERFEADLAAARALAAERAPVAAAPAVSRETAELLLLLQYVGKANAGCDSRGGAVVTELPPITWESDDSGMIGHGEGAIECEATLGADGTWQVLILAC